MCLVVWPFIFFFFFFYSWCWLCAHDATIITTQMAKAAAAAKIRVYWINIVEIGYDVNNGDDDDDDCLFPLVSKIWNGKKSWGAQPNSQFFAIYFYRIRNTFDGGKCNILRWLHHHHHHYCTVCLSVWHFTLHKWHAEWERKGRKFSNFERFESHNRYARPYPKKQR